MELDRIIITGARQHNLKNVTVEIPKKKLVILTGVSGSGKSSLAFDTLYAEGQRRYIESLSAYARQFLGQMDKPKYDSIRGLQPTIAIEQKSASSNPRSTVGTITEIYDYLRVLFARVGEQRCHLCGGEVAPRSAAEIVEQVLALRDRIPRARSGVVLLQLAARDVRRLHRARHQPGDGSGAGGERSIAIDPRGRDRAVGDGGGARRGLGVEHHPRAGRRVRDRSR